MTLTRYRDDAPVDYMVLADDGEWVPASEALDEIARLKLAHEGAEQAWRRAEKENDRLREETGRAHSEAARMARELAAANALLASWVGSSVSQPELWNATRAHLAGQPAAPEPHIACAGCGCSHPPGGHMVAGVFTRTEAEYVPPTEWTGFGVCPECGETSDDRTVRHLASCRLRAWELSHHRGRMT